MPNKTKFPINQTLLLILMLGLGLRLIALTQSLWLDEAITGTVANGTLLAYLKAFAPTDFHPPLHYLMEMAMVRLFGASDLALRLPSLVFGMGTIVLVYALAKSYSTRAAWIAALFTAINPLLVYYSQEARMYAMATFLVTAAVLSFLYLEKSNHPRHKLLFALSLAASFLTHYATLFIIPVFFFSTQKKRQTSLLVLASLLPLALWSPILYQQLQSGVAQSGAWADVLGYASPKNILLLPVKFTLGRISLEPFILYLGVAAFTLISYFFILMRNPKLKDQKILWSWLIFPVLFTIIIAFKLPILSYFRLLFVLPAGLVLLALGAGSYRGNIKKLLAVLLISGISLSASQTYLTNPEFQREPWKQALNRIDHNLPENTLAIFTFSGLPAPWQWYQPAVPVEAVTPQGDWQARLSKANLFSTIALFEYGADIFDPNRLVFQWLKEHGFEEKGFYQYPGIGKIHILSRDQAVALLL